MRIYNKLDNKEFRKYLRKNLTPQEIKIWNLVRNHKILGLKFFRQYGIDRYTVDFYCPRMRLVIEADGGQHNTPEGRKNDLVRSGYFAELHIKVLRFWNSEIDGNIEGVNQRIYETIKQIIKTN